jgi:pyridoxal phosphate enzyme (YggS family)
MSIKENISNLKERIRMASEGSRFSEEVILLAATKTRTADEINEGLENGLFDIAENRVQEFNEKKDLVKGGRWHFIGHLQKNKVKFVCGNVYLIHSVDSFELAEKINSLAENKNIVQNILIQINKGEEESKSGISLEQAKDFVKKIDEELTNVKVMGLMAVLPISDDEEVLRKHFREVRTEFDNLKNENFKSAEMKYLSMGMSSDFEDAILEGSNIVRIGTAIFGPRNY